MVEKNLGEAEHFTDSLKIIPINNLGQLCHYLYPLTPGVLLVDVDYTIREAFVLKNIFRPGLIPDDSIKILTYLKNRNWNLVFATNQPRQGHQIARAVSSVRHYHIFPDALEDIVGEENVFGAGPMQLHYKSTLDSIHSVAMRVMCFENISNGIYMVGDRTRDAKFFKAVRAEVGKEKNIPAGAYFQMPQPPVWARMF